MGNKISRIPKYCYPKGIPFTPKDILIVNKSWKIMVRTLEPEDIKSGGTMFYRMEKMFNISCKKINVPLDLFSTLSHIILYGRTKDSKTFKKIRTFKIHWELWDIIGLSFLKSLEWGYSPIDFTEIKYSWLRGYSEFFHTII